jgi:outer membrane protein TolC
VTPLTPLEAPAEEPELPELPELDELESLAMERQPSARMKALEVETMRLERKKALSFFLPSVSLNMGWESDRVSFTGSGGTNWLVGFSLQLNLFDGLGSFARASEAAAHLKRIEAEKARADAAVRLEVRRAYLDRQAAVERIEVAREAVAQARESHRITEARYEGGLANVTELLRSQTALLEAEARRLGAVYEGRLSAARLELATGTLNQDSKAVDP